MAGSGSAVTLRVCRPRRLLPPPFLVRRFRTLVQIAAQPVIQVLAAAESRVRGMREQGRRLRVAPAPDPGLCCLVRRPPALCRRILHADRAAQGPSVR